MSVPTYDTLATVQGGVTVEKTLASWGFEQGSCSGERNNMLTDTWEGTITTVDAITDPLFNFEQQIVIRSGRQTDTLDTTGADNSFITTTGVVKFVGLLASAPQVKALPGGGQGHTYKFEGPQYALTKTVYQQLYKGSITNPYPLSEVILYTSTANPQFGLQYISVGDQIQAILQWVLDAYANVGLPAPFKYKGRILNNGVIDLSGSFTGGSTSLLQFVYNFAVDANSTIEPSFFTLYFPTFNIRAQSCMEAIRKCLEFSPRTNMVVDYSSISVDVGSDLLPSIYVRTIDNFAPVSVPLFDGTNHRSLNIQRRDDLVPRSVVIIYRITSTVNGQPIIDYSIDKWGPNGSNSVSDPNYGPRVLVDFIDLQGASITTTSAQMDCEPLPISFNSAQLRDWWSSPRGGGIAELRDSRARFQTLNYTGSGNSKSINSATPIAIASPAYTYVANGFDTTGTAVVKGQLLTAADGLFYKYKIVRGTHHSWMKTGTPLVSVKSVKVKALLSTAYVNYKDVAPGDTQGQLPVDETASDTSIAGDNHTTHSSAQHHCEMELTNGAGGTYTTLVSSTPGEVAIIGVNGLAQYLFLALSIKQYEGDYIKIDTLFDNSINLINRLNLSGGRAEWSTMNAQIQSIREDYGTHETSVRVGLARHLNAADFMALLNMWRNRRPWTNPAIRADNSES